MNTNDVEISVSDGSGAVVVVPSAKVQVKIGVGSGGTAAINQVCASTQPSQLEALHGRGPLAEAGAIAALAGAVVLSVQIPIVTLGTATSVVHAGTGTSVVTVTLDGTVGAYDDYYVIVKPTLGGTIATGPIQFQFSLDAGRTYSPVLALGTATTYAIPNTGITLNFAAGTMVAGDTYKFRTIAPKGNDAGVTAAIAALQASPYAIQGWGSMHLVGPITGSSCTVYQTNLETAATTYDVFTRMMTEARDASPATTWGGTGETEATWIGALQTDFSAVQARREGVGAGYYNMVSAFPILGTTFRYRRPGEWAVAARVTTIPTQRMASRVSDGQLSQIIVDPTSDPGDGFIYHDERITPGLTGSRFQALRTRVGKGVGFYLDLPMLMSPTGSDFTYFPQGSVIDTVCDIVKQTAADEIDNDLILNTNGTISESDALRIESVSNQAIKNNCTDVKMISGGTVVVSRTQNVRTTGKVLMTVTINGVGYVTEVDITVGFQH